MKTGPVLNEPIITAKQNRTHPHFQKQKSIRENSLAETVTVTVQGFQYLVDLGSQNTPRFHRVNKNKECSCGAPYCEAIEAVRVYLQAGGVRAPAPDGMPACPICGSKIFRDRNWDGRNTRELGWRCAKGGLRHFLEAKAGRIKKQLAENPWLIPPAPGYPGVRRNELMTWEECDEINRKVFLETGYDPTI
jgi:hypothetical protein